MGKDWASHVRNQGNGQPQHLAGWHLQSSVCPGWYGTGFLHHFHKGVQHQPVFEWLVVRQGPSLQRGSVHYVRICQELPVWNGCHKPCLERRTVLQNCVTDCGGRHTGLNSNLAAFDWSIIAVWYTGTFHWDGRQSYLSHRITHAIVGSEANTHHSSWCPVFPELRSSSWQTIGASYTFFLNCDRTILQQNSFWNGFCIVTVCL